MAWKDQHTAATVGGAGTALAGGLLMYGATPLSVALAPFTGGTSAALAPWLFGTGAALAAGGVGAAGAAGLDAASEDPQTLAVPPEVQAAIARSDRRGVVSRLLSPQMAAIQAMPNPYGGNPYARPMIVGHLTGDARNVNSGLAQTYADQAAEIENWLKKRNQWQQSSYDAVLGMDKTQTQLGSAADESYWAAHKLQEDIRRANADNQLARDELTGERIKAGAGIGHKLGGLLGDWKAGALKAAVQAQPPAYVPTRNDDRYLGGVYTPPLVSKKPTEDYEFPWTVR